MGVFITIVTIVTIVALVVAGFFTIVVVRTDLRIERAHGLLTLALLAAVALGLLWPPVLDGIAYAGMSRTDGPAIAMMVAFYTFATILASTLVGIAGLIEMAVARRWWWLAGLLAAMVLTVAMIFVPLYSELLTVFLLTVLPTPISNSYILPDAYLLASEAVVLLVCAGYAVRATWFHASPAAQVVASG